MATLYEHLLECNFEKYLDKLVLELDGKPVIVYGTGSMFQLIQENYDLSKLNIIGISDGKYSVNDDGKEDLGYKIISKENIKSHNVDVVLLGVKNYENLQTSFKENLLLNDSVQILPLVKKSLLVQIKEFFLGF